MDVKTNQQRMRLRNWKNKNDDDGIEVIVAIMKVRIHVQLSMEAHETRSEMLEGKINLKAVENIIEVDPVNAHREQETTEMHRKIETNGIKVVITTRADTNEIEAVHHRHLPHVDLAAIENLRLQSTKAIKDS
jgi:hypothetical protein